jgi:hypothetical protein
MANVYHGTKLAVNPSRREFLTGPERKHLGLRRYVPLSHLQLRALI